MTLSILTVAGALLTTLAVAAFYVTTCFRFTLHQTINRKEDPHVCYETAC